jgi:hypothetical protein
LTTGTASEIASRLNPEGTASFVTIRPSEDGVEFLAGERQGKRTLLLRDSQHDYLYEEGSAQ